MKEFVLLFVTFLFLVFVLIFNEASADFLLVKAEHVSGVQSVCANCDLVK